MVSDRPHYHGHRKRLRERFNKSGRIAFADYELLELLLTYSIPRVDTKPIAKALLHKFGSIIGVLQQSEERLKGIHGIGSKTATFLKVVEACLTRFAEIEVEQQLTISVPEDILSFVRMNLGNRSKECMYVFYLNKAQGIIYHCEVSAGTVDRTPFYPREILKPALIHNATSFILVHNHPEGRPIPSEKDLEMTRKLEDISSNLSIKLLDHLIVTQSKAYSIKTGKLL